MVQAILSDPAVDKLKPVRHLLRLAEKYSTERLERACERAFNAKIYSYRSVKNILEKNLDSQPLGDEGSSKIVPLPLPRFARNPNDYKSEFDNRESFEEVLQRACPFSKHGNGMMGAYQGMLTDQIMEEEILCQANAKQKEKSILLS